MLRLLVCLAASLALVRGVCRGRADVVIAIPGGTEVPPLEFDAFEENVIQILNYLHIEQNDFNIGLILYGSSPVDIAWPKPYKNRTQINTRVTLMARKELYEHDLVGTSDVVKAVESIMWMLTQPAPGYTLRPDTTKIGIVFQQGASQSIGEARNIAKAALKARRLGVMMYAVGAFGKKQPGPEFKYMAYDVCRRFPIATFSKDLKGEVPNIANSICSVFDTSASAIRGTNKCYTKKYKPVTPVRPACYPGDTMISDPSNCGYYHYCAFAKPVQLQCSHNTIFDPQIGGCNYMHDVPCYANVDLTCDFPSGLFEHPTHCSKFLNCHDSVAHVTDCPERMWFDERQGACVNRDLITCPSHKFQ